MSGLARLALAAVIVAALTPLAAQQRQPPLVLSQLTWFDRAGKQLGKLGPLADHGNLELSPDGSRVAVAVVNRALRTRDIWMYQVAFEGRKTERSARPSPS